MRVYEWTFYVTPQYSFYEPISTASSWAMGLVHLCLYLEQSIELRVGHLLVLGGGGSSGGSGCWSSAGSVRRRQGGGSGW